MEGMDSQKNSASSGSAISLNIGCDMTKAAAKRRITFYRIPSARNWSRVRKNGRSFILATACDRSSTGRDGALRRLHPRSAAQCVAWFARHVRFVPPAVTRAGTSQRDVPTSGLPCCGATCGVVRTSRVIRSARCNAGGDIAARCPYQRLAVLGRNAWRDSHVKRGSFRPL